MFNLITNLAKAAVAVAATPIALVADVLTLPASATNNDDPFGLTEATVKAAKDAFDAAVKPTK